MPREWVWVWVVCKSEPIRLNLTIEDLKTTGSSSKRIFSKQWVGVTNRLETGVLFEI